MDKNMNLLKEAIVEGFNQRIDDTLSSQIESAPCSKRHEEAMKAILAGKVTGNIVWTTKARRIVALLVAALLLLTSCAVIYRDEIYNWVMGGKVDNYFPDGYTGGMGIPSGSDVEYYWVETYEECVEAIELLKSHGSTFEQWPIFTYNGELFDTKYCFKMNGARSDEIQYGENPFDRKSEGVRVQSIVFVEDVEIDELVYEDIAFYDSYILFVPGTSELGVLDEYPNADGFTYEWVVDDSTDFFSGAYFIYIDGKLALSLSPVYRGGHELSDEIVTAVLDSIVVIK